MTISLAPMEGITGYNLRQAINTYFEGIDRYYSPFVTPHLKRPMTNRELEDVKPANNAGIRLTPQIMTNENEGFNRLLSVLQDFGYNEVNLNLGCPSRTVTARGRGSGFLRYPEELDSFLAAIYKDNPDIRLSLKTRVGYDTDEMWVELLDIYNSYPITELIVHPRIGAEAYNGVPRMEKFTYALKNSKAPVVYNGDIYTKEDYENLLAFCKNEAGTEPAGVMLGRGLVRNPALARIIKGGAAADPSERYTYLNAVIRGYKEILHDDVTVLHKMKEIWVYMQRDFPGQEKLCKKMFKCKKYDEFAEIQKAIVLG